MASSYSPQISYEGFQKYTPNFQLITTALQYKQGKLDANRQKLQAVRDQFGMLDVAKDADEKYLDERLQQVTDITNQYANGDLSSDALTNSLISNVGQVLDKNVKNAVLSTKILRGEQSEWAKHREKADGKYNDNNYAYAMRRANAWMNDNTVGTTYGGGGGFIEYVDVQDKILKALPEIQKQATFETKRRVDDGTIFGSIVTEKSIDRGKMDSALSMILDDKARQQLQINAWAQYDNLPDEAVRQQYEDFTQAQLDSTDSSLKQYQDRLELATDPEEISQLKYAIESHKARRDSIESVDFDAVGKQNAYTTMYMDKFKNDYLDAFSYAPVVTDIKVDESTKASLEFEEMVRHNLKTEEIAEMKALSSSKGNKAVASTSGVVTDMTLVDQGEKNGGNEYSESDVSGLMSAQMSEREAINGLNSVLKSSLNPDDYVEVAKNMKDLAGKASRGESITIKGQTISVKDNLKTLLKFQNQVLNINPERKAIRKDLRNSVDQIIFQLSKSAASSNADLDIQELPKYQWKLVKGADGRLIKAPLKNPDKNYYATLLYKKGNGKQALSEEEEATLKAYTSMHLISDPDIKDLGRAEKTELFKTLRDDILKNMSFKEFSKIASNVDEVMNVSKASLENGGGILRKTDLLISQNPWFQNKVKGLLKNSTVVTLNTQNQINELGDMYKRLSYARPSEKDILKSKIKSLESKIERTSSFVEPRYTDGEDTYLSEIEDTDLDYYSKKLGREVNISTAGGAGIAGLINTNLQQIKSRSEAIRGSYNLASVKDMVISKDSNVYGGLSSLAFQKGLITGDYTGPIVVRPTLDKGQKLSDSVDLVVNQKVDGQIKQVPTKVSRKELAALGVEFEDMNRTEYSANFGKDAAKISLGNTNGKGSTFWENADATLNEAQKLNVAPEVKNIMANFKNNKYNFKVEVLDNGVYNNCVYLGGQLVYSEPTSIGEFNYDDVEQVYQNSDEFAGIIMNNYLSDEIKQLSLSNKLSQ
jgi:hypothetical protein